MREILPLLQGPARYAGMEDGACRKDSPRLRMALAFPDKYEVGMSYLGHKILYGIVNARQNWQAERVFAPDAAVARILREKGLPLATLESDTPLCRLAAVGFAVTTELSFPNLLYMLDLGHVPLRQKDRPDSLRECPAVIVGGGAAMGAEALAPFADIFCLGDGEECLPEVLQALEDCLDLGRNEFLKRAAKIPGVYVPSFFRMGENGLEPLCEWHKRPGRRVVEDLDKVAYPQSQVVPVGAIHERLALEIARGCTRGCRFCHAGMVYRPVRERSVGNLAEILEGCLAQTGFEEISFLSLSTGDFSALRLLCEKTIARCAEEQISLSLPSLRVGSIDNGLLARMAGIRRTGATIAPEAGSQRLRDVINKGITEDDLMRHARSLLALGWRSVKLYFMIGLPSETDEDLAAIVDLCGKVRMAGGNGAPRLNVTLAISPFVPKPFTPFQWEGQIDPDEMLRRINYIRQLASHGRGISVHWHDPWMSRLEGILSRAGREMADALELAYMKGAIFPAWAEHFSFAPWQEAFAECGIDANALAGPRTPGETLPWSHLESGISEKFLLMERRRAFAASTTPDCRYAHCRQCGVCDSQGSPSRLPKRGGEKFVHRLNFAARDQQGQDGEEEIPREQKRPDVSPALKTCAARYLLEHRKMGDARWLSQLDLAAMLGRALRRAKMPLAFSQGFHPMPRISFGRAIPVGLESENEWLVLGLYRRMPENEILERLNHFLPDSLKMISARQIDSKKQVRDASREEFSLFAADGELEQAACLFSAFMAQDSFPVLKDSKRGKKSIDIRAPLLSCDLLADRLVFVCDWQKEYFSPVFLLESILAPLYQQDKTRQNMRLVKTARFFD